MVDGRYHRSPNAAPDGPEKTMLGAAQLTWLKRELLGSEDAWAVFRHERDPFLRWIDEQKIEGVVFLSGDRHFSSGYHILGRFLELSGGPFGSVNAKLRPNAERFTGFDKGRLWGVLDIDTTGAFPAVAFEFWQAGGGRLERVNSPGINCTAGRRSRSRLPSRNPPDQSDRSDPTDPNRRGALDAWSRSSNRRRANQFTAKAMMRMACPV